MDSKNTSRKSKNKGNGKQNRSESLKKRTKSELCRQNLTDADIVSDNTRRNAFPSENDVSWYAKNEALLKAGASFPYGYPLGAPAYLNNDLYTHAGKLVVSGICTINLVPFVGKSTNAVSAVNIAARKLYGWIRQANSGARNYEYPDLMLYITAMDSIYYMYWNALRAYGTIMLYNQQNRYVPEALALAMGFDPEDIRANYAQLRYGLLKLATQINNLVVPDTMDIFKRHRWLFSNLYADGTSPKAQIYMYRPEGYYTFELNATTKAGQLKWNKLTYATETTPNTGYTVDQYLSIMYSMIQPVLSNYDEDFATMAGDIMKAYDASQLITLPGFAEDYTVIPVYDEEVLSQIQNATLLGRPTAESLDITQIVDVANTNAGALICNPLWQQLNATSTGFKNITSFSTTFDPAEYDARSMKRLVSLNKNAPTPADTMVATRLTAILQPSAGNTGYLELASSGSEIATVGTIFKMTYGDEEASIDVRNFYLDRTVNTNTNNATVSNVATSLTTADYNQLIDMLGDCIRMAHFRFHPMLIISVFPFDSMTTASGAVNGQFALTGARLRPNSNVTNYFLMEIDNYTMLDRSDLEQLHTIAIMSEYDI